MRPKDCTCTIGHAADDSKCEACERAADVTRSLLEAWVRRMATYADSVGHTPEECADGRCFYCAARVAVAKWEGRP